ncbi:hypothetical protein BM1_01323 [Bipolaris maydis]|nr:hypothetical protein BM1_01323 [Bipolaris maydis]
MYIAKDNSTMRMTYKAQIWKESRNKVGSYPILTCAGRHGAVPTTTTTGRMHSEAAESSVLKHGD